VAEWYDQPEAPKPVKKVEDPGFWEGLLTDTKNIPENVLKRIRAWAQGATSKPVQGMSGEPTAEMVSAMAPKAKKRNLLDSYNTDDGDIKKKREP
jgi:hypothetical protein